MNKQESIDTGALADNEVIKRVLQGEKDLYAIIVQRYNQRLYRVGMSIINDDAEVEELMQSAYIKAYENLGKFEFRSAFSTWLTRILINEALLRIKQRKKTIHYNHEDMGNLMNQRSVTEKQTPVMKTLNVELKTLLEDAISRLPEKYRTIFIMREMENMSVAETTECLAISQANVKVRLNRAKNLLKESLSEYYNHKDLLHFHLSRCNSMVERVMASIGALPA